MKLDTLTIAGFRGFNSEREIRMHPRLTLISAPNSYGKTSVAEALEFLLFGVTSKVQNAHSVEEYKDSYRNRHFPDGQPIFVEAKCLSDDQTALTIRRTLKPDGATKCLVGNAVCHSART
jgi:recombinational DNA repair ATPase RecF